MQALFDIPPTLSVPWAAPAAPADGPRAPLQVAMGELKAGARTDQLSALLGSCVGIGLIWKKRGRYALAHCLLPECAQLADAFGARYVNQAVPSLLRLIGASEQDHGEIEVIVAGGATMLNGCSSRLQIGQQNTEAARKHLRKFGLNVTYCRVGGKCGRTMTIDCATGAFAVHELATTYAGALHV